MSWIFKIICVYICIENYSYLNEGLYFLSMDQPITASVLFSLDTNENKHVLTNCC